MKNIAMFALLTSQGTAMAVSAICEACYQDERMRKMAREWALADADYDGQEFKNVTGNDALECQFCGHQSV